MSDGVTEAEPPVGVAPNPPAAVAQGEGELLGVGAPRVAEGASGVPLGEALLPPEAEGLPLEECATEAEGGALPERLPLPLPLSLAPVEALAVREGAPLGVGAPLLEAPLLPLRGAEREALPLPQEEAEAHSEAEPVPPAPLTGVSLAVREGGAVPLPLPLPLPSAGEPLGDAEALRAADTEPLAVAQPEGVAEPPVAEGEPLAPPPP